MNTMLTTRCNRNCTFCFAGTKYHKDISMDDVKTVLDFHRASNISDFRVLGGEPTLHPLFKDIISLAVSEGFSIYIMSNCIMPAHVVDFLSTIEDMNIMCNASAQATDSIDAINKREYAFTTIGHRIVLSVTATQPFIDHTWIADTINKYHMIHAVRIGVAQPCGIKGGNVYLHPNNYEMFGNVLQSAAAYLDKRNIMVYVDCGMVHCMRPSDISVDDFDAFVFCDPVVDITPDLNVYRCFPLSTDTTFPLSDFTDREHIVSFFNDHYASIANKGCRAQCTDCVDADVCTKGCLSYKLT